MGGSIYTLTGFGVGLTGPSLPLAMLLTGLLVAFPTVLVYAELGSSRPEAGGGYLWVREGLGPVHGHFFGWFSWCAHAVACGVYSLSFGYYLFALLSAVVLPVFNLSLPGAEWEWKVFFAILTISALSILNYRGVKLTAGFGRVAILIAVGVILFFSAFGIWGYLKGSHPPQTLFQLTSLQFGIDGLLAAMGLIFLDFQGFEVIAQTAEEMKRPRANIPKALFLTFCIMLFIYLLSTSAAILGVQGQELSWKILSGANEGALVKAATYFPLQHLLVPVVVLGGAIVGLAALNATIYSASHVFYAMAKSGRSLPAGFEAVHPKYGTPFIGIIATGLLSVVMVLFFPIRDIAATVDLLFFFLFALVHLAYIQFRRKYPELPRPFKAAFYPWLSLFALVMLAILSLYVVRINPWSLSFFLGWLILGMVIHRVYVERQESGEFVRGKVAENSERINPSVGFLILFTVAFQAGWWRDILPYVAAMARENNGEIFALCLIEGDARVGEERIQEQRKDAIHAFHAELVRSLSELGITYTVRSQLTSNVNDTILLAVQKLDADLLFFPYKYVARRLPDRIARSRSVLSPDFRRILRESRCDLIMFKPAPYQQPRRMLVAATESAHNKFLGHVTRSLGDQFQAALTMVHVAERGPGSWDAVLEDLGFTKDAAVGKRWLVAENVADKILEASKEHDLILLGAGDGSMFEAIALGTTAQLIANRSDKPVFMCYQHQEFPLFTARFVDSVIGKVSQLGSGGVPSPGAPKPSKAK